MRKLALLLSLLTAPASAAETITITMTSDGAGGTYNGTLTKTYTLSAADMLTFQNWMQAQYPCSPAPCGTTVPIAANGWVAAWKQGLVNQVVAWQQQVQLQGTPAAINPN